MRKLDRREFAQEASLVFLAGVTVTVSGCGGGGGGGGDYGSPTAATTTPTTTPSGSSNGSKTGQISGNHGHQAVITAAQLQAGGALRIDIASTAGHSHIVDLPAQAVQQIRDGQPVQKDSTTTQDHLHTVTFNPESPDDPNRY